MRRMIIVVSLVAAPLVAAAPATAAADHQAAVTSDAAVVTAVPARGGLTHPFAAPPAPQTRDAATPRQSAGANPDIEAAVPLRYLPGRGETASACAGAPAAPSARVSAGSALARAPPPTT